MKTCDSQLPSRQSVLIVEDDEATCLLLKTVLPGSYAVDSADDPLRALKMAREHSYDLILLDIHLGDTQIDGIGILKKLRGVDVYKKRPIVAVTAYAMPGDQQRFLGKGFDGYVPKPFTQQTLFAVLEEVLGS